MKLLIKVQIKVMSISFIARVSTLPAVEWKNSSNTFPCSAQDNLRYLALESLS